MEDDVEIEVVVEASDIQSDPPKYLALKVKDREGNEVCCKVKETTRFTKVMSVFCKNVGAELETMRFFCDALRLRPEQTPADLGMKDDNEIYAIGASWVTSCRSEFEFGS